MEDSAWSQVSIKDLRGVRYESNCGKGWTLAKKSLEVGGRNGVVLGDKLSGMGIF